MTYLQERWMIFSWHHASGAIECGAKFMAPAEAEYWSHRIEYEQGESCTYRSALPCEVTRD